MRNEWRSIRLCAKLLTCTYALWGAPKRGAWRLMLNEWWSIRFCASVLACM